MKISFRTLSPFLTGAAFVALALTAPNCSPSGGDLGSGGSSGSNGGSGSGGSNNGGSQNKGGSNNGGSNSNGGSNNGGSNSSGGSNNGGSNSSGGSSSSNGGSSSSNGGSSSSNGGSTSSNGGAVAAGGSTSTGTGTTPTGTTVTFASGKAVGAMTGYGWVALGSADAITDPTCGATKTPITSAAPCAADTQWTGTDKLCISGSAPALPASPTAADYSSNYGIVVGVNATDPAGGGLGQAFTTITIAATGVPTSTVRAQIHKKGDPAGTSYCLAYSSSAMTLAKFATDCYATAPAGLFAAADAANIDQVSLEAVSGTTAVTVSSMCITGITFGK